MNFLLVQSVQLQIDMSEYHIRDRHIFLILGSQAFQSLQIRELLGRLIFHQDSTLSHDL